MEITDDLIDHIAHLSRLSFEGAEKERIKSDLNKIINFMGKLEEIDTNNVEPLIFMTDETNVLREDAAIQTLSQEEALKNAPKRDTDYFRIPKVLSK
jgi:aspartyl-tRNA(Asn)/glutamyl-tRNA(Gln) amidotransferase subunit C